MCYKHKGFVIFVNLVIIISILTGCSEAENTDTASQSQTQTLPISENYFIFDTVVSVRVYDERIEKSHFDYIESIMEQIDETMNRFKEESEVAKVNRLAGEEAVQVTEETYHIIKTAKEYALRSEGRFEPTIGPLVDLWAIGNGGSEVPPIAEIDAAKQLIDFNKLELNDDSLTVKLQQKGMTLDLGAIAKGYAADVIASYLQEQGFTSAIIDLGGNILAMGSKPDKSPWRIGIQSPDENRGEHLGTISVVNKTIVTSGVYERYFIYDNKQYHHIIDPFTGYPAANELASATIITEKSMHADAMSTTVFLLGLEEGMAFVESTENTEAIFVTNDHKVYVTSGLKDNFKLTRQEYELVE